MAGCLKRIAILVAVIIGLFLAAILVTQISVSSRLRREYAIAVTPVTVPDDDEAIRRGFQLVRMGRCTECHGSTLGGQVTSDDPTVGQIYASNLTTGLGGVGRTYSDEDWVRAIRHGIGQDGRSLVITPAQYYNRLSDEDLGAIIAYIKSVPPVDQELPESRVGIISRLYLGLFSPRDWLPAEKIDHQGKRPSAPEPGVTAGYGEYLVQITTCLVCHSKSDLAAGQGGPLSGWDVEEFARSLRNGVGTEYDFYNESMRAIASHLTDDEIAAMWLYLQTLRESEE